MDGRIAASGGGPSRDCSGCLVIPGNVCAHTHLYSALARGMPYALAPPTNFTQILQRIWWRLDRALDEDDDQGVGARGRDGGAALGHDDARRPPRVAERDRRLARHRGGGAGQPRRALGALLRDLRPRRARARARGRDGEPPLPRPRAAGAPPARPRDGRRPRLVHALGRDARRLLRGRRRLRRRPPRPRGRGRGGRGRLRGPLRRPRRRAAPPGRRARRAHAARARRPPRRRRDRARPRGRRVARPQRPLQHEQLDRPRPRRTLLGPRVSLGTDGIGSDMFEESRAAFFRLREDDSTAGGDWPLRRLAEGAHLAGRAFGEPAARHARGGRSRRPRRPRLPGADARARRQLRRPLGLRALLAERARRHGRGRVGRPRPAARAGRPAAARRRGARRGGAPVAATGRDRAPPIRAQGSKGG